MDLFETIAILATLVLLPLIPAWLLFKYLPSGADTTGTLAGLKVKLGGAFGGYVALTVFLAWFFANFLRGPIYHDWHVTGQLQFEGNGPAEISSVSCVLRPPTLPPLESGRAFEFDMPLPDSGKNPPRLLFQVPGYQPCTVYLLKNSNDGGCGKLEPKVDRIGGNVEFPTPIVLKKLPPVPYTPTVDAQEIPAPPPGGRS